MITINKTHWILKVVGVVLALVTGLIWYSIITNTADPQGLYIHFILLMFLIVSFVLVTLKFEVNISLRRDKVVDGWGIVSVFFKSTYPLSMFSGVDVRYEKLSTNSSGGHREAYCYRVYLCSSKVDVSLKAFSDEAKAIGYKENLAKQLNFK